MLGFGPLPLQRAAICALATDLVKVPGTLPGAFCLKTEGQSGDNPFPHRHLAPCPAREPAPNAPEGQSSPQRTTGLEETLHTFLLGLPPTYSHLLPPNRGFRARRMADMLLLGSDGNPALNSRNFCL